MIDRDHDLPLTRQAAVLNISRGSLYYKPRPVSAADLALMRRMDLVIQKSLRRTDQRPVTARADQGEEKRARAPHREERARSIGRVGAVHHLDGLPAHRTLIDSFPDETFQLHVRDRGRPRRPHVNAPEHSHREALAGCLLGG